MTEYIERAALKRELAPYEENDFSQQMDVILAIVDAQPAADVVEVVRCKDCIWRGREECAMFYRCDCGEQHTWETDNDFCSYVERRDENA